MGFWDLWDRKRPDDKTARENGRKKLGKRERDDRKAGDKYEARRTKRQGGVWFW